jgi:hypothetical protein
MVNYQTKDFYLSAYLVINSCKLKNCIAQNGLSLFEFNDTELLKGLVSRFYSMKGECDALTYSGAVRNLKSIIHAAKSYSKQLSTSKHEGINHEFFNETRGNL